MPHAPRQICHYIWECGEQTHKIWLNRRIRPRKERGVRSTGSRETCAWCPARHRLTPRGAGLTPDTDSRWTLSPAARPIRPQGEMHQSASGWLNLVRGEPKSLARFLAKSGLYGPLSSFRCLALRPDPPPRQSPRRDVGNDFHRNSDGSFEVPSPGRRILGEPGNPEAPLSSREGRTVRRYSLCDSSRPCYRATRFTQGQLPFRSLPPGRMLR